VGVWGCSTHGCELRTSCTGDVIWSFGVLQACYCGSSDVNGE
jgi:hypothetical protein